MRMENGFVDRLAHAKIVRYEKDFFCHRSFRGWKESVCQMAYFFLSEALVEATCSTKVRRAIIGLTKRPDKAEPIVERLCFCAEKESER